MRFKLSLSGFLAIATLLCGGSLPPQTVDGSTPATDIAVAIIKRDNLDGTFSDYRYTSQQEDCAAITKLIEGFVNLSQVEQPASVPVGDEKPIVVELVEHNSMRRFTFFSDGFVRHWVNEALVFGVSECGYQTLADMQKRLPAPTAPIVEIREEYPLIGSDRFHHFRLFCDAENIAMAAGFISNLAPCTQPEEPFPGGSTTFLIEVVAGANSMQYSFNGDYATKPATTQLYRIKDSDLDKLHAMVDFPPLNPL